MQDRTVEIEGRHAENAVVEIEGQRADSESVEIEGRHPGTTSVEIGGRRAIEASSEDLHLEHTDELSQRWIQQASPERRGATHKTELDGHTEVEDMSH